MRGRWNKVQAQTTKAHDPPAASNRTRALRRRPNCLVVKGERQGLIGPSEAPYRTRLSTHVAPTCCTKHRRKIRPSIAPTTEFVQQPDNVLYIVRSDLVLTIHDVVCVPASEQELTRDLNVPKLDSLQRRKQPCTSRSPGSYSTPS